MRVIAITCSPVTHFPPGPCPTDPYYPALRGITGHEAGEESSPRAVWLSFESDSEGELGPETDAAAGFLNLDPIHTAARCSVRGDLFTSGLYMPGAPPPVVALKHVCRFCQIPAGNTTPPTGNPWWIRTDKQSLKQGGGEDSKYPGRNVSFLFWKVAP